MPHHQIGGWDDIFELLLPGRAGLLLFCPESHSAIGPVRPALTGGGLVRCHRRSSFNTLTISRFNPPFGTDAMLLKVNLNNTTRHKI